MSTISIHHIQITVPEDSEEQSITFYRDILGFAQITKPASLAANRGAWFKVGNLELHVSPEPMSLENAGSKRHVCYLVESLTATQDLLEQRGVAIIEDKQPVPNWVRFYVRDPGGNRLEFAAQVP
jgi:catechol 2,3-dioxygenase-like lactoylglutathione lyase family enzyme